MKTLGKLERVRIQDVWPHEATSFTPWLAGEENIALLGEEINMDLEVQGQEERVGPFRADILCRDTATDNFVLIENQYGSTDHKHLGQLMTYASGLNAVTIVWISEKFTEEHRAALDWLNSKTDETVEFFGIEIELYRIGDSLPAAKFNVVSKPNNWSRTVRRTASIEGFSDRRKMYLEYWTTFKAFCEKEKAKFTLQTPRPHHAIASTLGRSHFHILAFALSRDSEIGVSLILGGPHSMENFIRLREKYEKESLAYFGPQVEWDEKADQNRQRVSVIIPNVDSTATADWPNQHKILKDLMEKFHTFFKDKIKAL